MEMYKNWRGGCGLFQVKLLWIRGALVFYLFFPYRFACRMWSELGIARRHVVSCAIETDNSFLFPYTSTFRTSSKTGLSFPFAR